jgi:hypothetical protein
MNIHDEVLAVTKPELIPEVEAEVNKCVEEFKPQVPLLSIGWGPMKSWSKNIQAEDVVTGNVPPDKLAAIRRGETWRWITLMFTEPSTILP